MAKTRVLVVDDSATLRALLVETIGSDPGLELVGVAADGQQAVELCRLHRPDVVTMDMMMPVMTGLAATEQIMAQCPTPILVVSSSFNRGELFKMYDALTAGAVDVLEKPGGNEPDGEWERRFLSMVRIVSRVRVVTRRVRVRHVLSHHAIPTPAPGEEPVRLVAIGASTGGPGAAVEVLRNMRPELDVPVLFVLHINPQFGLALADWLGTQIPWPTRFGRDGEMLSAARGTVLLAPPGQHMLVRDGRIRLDEGPERFSCRPSVDVLFESVARECGPSAAAALLTGMGRDGASGLLAIRAAGGRTIAQDEASSVVYGMPREAVLIGGAQSVLPLTAIGPALAGFVRARSAVA